MTTFGLLFTTFFYICFSPIPLLISVYILWTLTRNDDVKSLFSIAGSTEVSGSDGDEREFNF